MAGFVGADIAQLEALAAEFGRRAEQLEQLTTTIHSRVYDTVGQHWSGNDADQFRNSWDGEYRKSLNLVIASLKQAQSAVRQNAAEQRQASGGG